MSPRPEDFDSETQGLHERPRLRPSISRRRPVLRWTDAAGAHSTVLEERQVLGSAPDVDLVVADPTVSRIHAELEPREDGVWVKDLESRNGTYVEGLLVSGARVEDGGRLRLGTTVLTVRYEERADEQDAWPGERFGPLLGQSAVMGHLFRRLARIAPTASTVLIQGETGTGKELVARAIHEASDRRGGPYVIVDCGAMPEQLLEAELFGHARGAFTGAAQARVGAIEAADGGTVFLDEVGELPLALQPKLLRFLESRTVRRLGEVEQRAVDVRVLSATHRDLRKLVNAGAFREDLYFRLAVIPVNVPSLRERREDIPLLVRGFLPPEAGTMLSQELLAELQTRPWLGNVRELRNFVERMIALGEHEALSMEATSSAQAAPSMAEVPLDLPFKEVRERWLEHLEREYLRGLLERHGRNVSAVAQASGLNRTYVHRLIRKHEL